MLSEDSNYQIRPAWARYGVAIASVVLGWAAREALTSQVGPTALPFIFFFPAVAMAAWYGRGGAGLLATLLSLGAAKWFFVVPIHSWSIQNSSDVAALGAFVTGCLFIVGAMAAMHRARANEVRQRLFTDLTLASIGDGVITTDEKGNVRFLNREAERLTGWKVAEAIGQPLTSVFRIINETTRQTVENPAEKVLRTGTVVALENHTVVVSKDGTETPIEDSAAPIREGEKACSGVVLVFRDATEQRRAHEAAARLAAVVEHSGDVILSKDLNGVIRSWNASAEKLFGYRAEEIVGKPVTTLFPPERLNEEDYILGNLRQGKPVERLETIRIAKDGRRIPVAVSISPLLDPSGQVIGASKIIHDITELTAAREALMREKELLSTTLASIGDAVIVTDPNGNVTFLNGEAERLTGWTTTEASHRPLPEVFRIFNEQTREKVENPVEKVLRLGGIVGLANHTILIDKQGKEIAIDDSAAPIRTPGGPMFGIVMVFRDVTEQRKVQAAAIEREKELEAIIDRTSFMLTRCSRDLHYRFVSRAYAKMIGRNPEQLIGKPIAEIMGEEGFKTILPYVTKVLAGEPVEYERGVHFAGVGVRELHVVYTPEHDAHGNIQGWIASISDITERKSAEEALRSTAEELKRSLRAKDEFLAALSHELRNPLTPVLMSAASLETDTELPAEAREQLAMMRRNIELEARLIDDLLDVARISRGKISLAPEPVDIHQLLGHTGEIVLSGGSSRRVDINFALNAERHHAMADPARLQQVFWNLINNALKFTPVDGSVTVSTQNDCDGKIVVIVRDTGIGIATSDLNRIFRAFEQIETTGHLRTSGLGLGLAISKTIIDLHAGEICAESDGLGHGATFRVTLATIDPRGIARRPQTPKTKPSRTLRILVVDDHDTTLAALTRLLARDGHHVVGAGTVQQALAAAASEHFDVLISDIGLPDGNGLDLMREIQRQKPILGIALSGYGMEDDVKKAREAGYLAHLVKPVNLDQVRHLLARILEPT